MKTSSENASVGKLGLRGFLAGTGATGALIAAAVIAFFSLASFVAFKAPSLGGSSSGKGRVYVASEANAPNGAGARAAAVALTGALPAVASAPAAPPPGAGTVPTAASGLVAAPTRPTAPPGTAPTPPGTLPPGPPPTPPPACCVVPPPSQPGVVGNLVQDLGHTSGSLGLGPATASVTGPVDKTVTGTLNGVGRAAGMPHLGDGVTSTATGLEDYLLGKGG